LDAVIFVEIQDNLLEALLIPQKLCEEIVNSMPIRKKVLQL